MERLLVVDDEKNYLVILEALLTGQGYQVQTAASAEEALGLIDEDLDLVVTDMTMPGLDGIELLDRVRQTRPDLPIILMTAHGTVERAVQAMKLGAFDYLTKPFKNEDLLRTIHKALELGRLQRENRQLVQALQERHHFGSLVGKSRPMTDIFRLIEKVADTRANVLITGESGTGKELIAKAVHYTGSRAGGPFVAVNCSALAETLLESELFGHERGAFTDARQTRKGRFELAGGGTLFLDEIGEMSTNLQAKLLRVLQERRFERVGGMVTIDVDVRVIAATNRDLKKEVAAGRFREDLFYRLNVVHLPIPPLRARLDDLPLLVSHFLEKYGSQRPDRQIREVAPEALRKLYAYSWPGNVRELENVIERAVILCSGLVITVDDLPPEIESVASNGRNTHPSGPTDPGASAGSLGPDHGSKTADSESPDRPTFSRPPSDAGPKDAAEAMGELDPRRLFPELPHLPEALETLEKALIGRALARSNQVQTRAADLLGVKNTALHYKIKKHRPEDLGRDYGLPLDLNACLIPGPGLDQVIETVEKGLIEWALREAAGIQTAAADRLGISKKLLYYKLKKYRLDA